MDTHDGIVLESRKTDGRRPIRLKQFAVTKQNVRQTRVTPYPNRYDPLLRKLKDFPWPTPPRTLLTLLSGRPSYVHVCVCVARVTLTGYRGNRRHVGGIDAHVVTVGQHVHGRRHRFAVARVSQFGDRPYFGHSRRVARQHYPRVVGTADHRHGLFVRRAHCPAGNDNDGGAHVVISLEKPCPVVEQFVVAETKSNRSFVTRFGGRAFIIVHGLSIFYTVLCFFAYETRRSSCHDRTAILHYFTISGFNKRNTKQTPQ